jgi:hypothetical protein
MASAKLTPQQENFARHVVMGFSGAAAYRMCYRVKPGSAPSTQIVAASKLLAKANVRQRVVELREEAARTSIVSRETLLAEMDVNRTLAIDSGRHSVAQTASRDRARLAGHLGGQGSHRPPDAPVDAAAAAVLEGDVTVEEHTMFDVARRVAFILEQGRRRALSPPPKPATE